MISLKLQYYRNIYTNNVLNSRRELQSTVDAFLKVPVNVYVNLLYLWELLLYKHDGFSLYAYFVEILGFFSKRFQNPVQGIYLYTEHSVQQSPLDIHTDVIQETSLHKHSIVFSLQLTTRMLQVPSHTEAFLCT